MAAVSAQGITVCVVIRLVSRGCRDAALNQSFVEGAVWPIDRAALAALIDMGLSNDRIAAYVVVVVKVRARREHYGFGA
jgi:hypothetical protein